MKPKTARCWLQRNQWKLAAGIPVIYNIDGTLTNFGKQFVKCRDLTCPNNLPEVLSERRQNEKTNHSTREKRR